MPRIERHNDLRDRERDNDRDADQHREPAPLLHGLVGNQPLVDQMAPIFPAHRHHAAVAMDLTRRDALTAGGESHFLDRDLRPFDLRRVGSAEPGGIELQQSAQHQGQRDYANQLFEIATQKGDHIRIANPRGIARRPLASGDSDGHQKVNHHADRYEE